MRLALDLARNTRRVVRTNCVPSTPPPGLAALLRVRRDAFCGDGFQALFRKLATALPGMESAPATSNNANLIDIKVRSQTIFHSCRFLGPIYLLFLAARFAESKYFFGLGLSFVGLF